MKEEDNTGARYSLHVLQEHTNIVWRQTEKVFSDHCRQLDEALTEFSSYFDDLEKQPPTLERNVKILLACKFLNHVYAAVILIRCGLVVEAVLCARNALEVAAYHWLVCLDPAAAEQYNQDACPRPVEVRRRLQRLGVDGARIGQLYSMDSEFTHVGRSWESFGLAWQTSGRGSLRVGGAFREKDGEHLFGEFLPFLIAAFRMPPLAQQG